MFYHRLSARPIYLAATRKSACSFLSPARASSHPRSPESLSFVRVLQTSWPEGGFEPPYCRFIQSSTLPLNHSGIWATRIALAAAENTAEPLPLLHPGAYRKQGGVRRYRSGARGGLRPHVSIWRTGFQIRRNQPAMRPLHKNKSQNITPSSGAALAAWLRH